MGQPCPADGQSGRDEDMLVDNNTAVSDAENITRGNRRAESNLTRGGRRGVTEVKRGSRRGRPELDLREQWEGRDGPVHTRVKSGSMLSDAMMEAVIT